MKAVLHRVLGCLVIELRGKTGTARIVGPSGYDDERHVAWFAGLVPVSDPRLVVVVWLTIPKLVSAEVAQLPPRYLRAWRSAVCDY